MDGAKLRILEAAIAAIEEYGFKNITVRRIAAKADVNVAAINYYFRTKEQLLEQVIALTLENTFDWSDLAYADNLPPKEMLFAVIDHLSRNALNYPEITRAHYFEAMVNGHTDTQAVKALNGFMETLLTKLLANGCTIPEKSLRLTVTQVFMAGLFAVGVAPAMFDAFSGIQMANDGDRRQFLRHLIDGLMAE
ncbi:TetR/AcrR family transcriptional regulator [Oscillospiraceae bacterium CM]|nr:TetR/AcrR family transcriptional regulator [Oscillospiraceae bacterium CM]